MKKVLRKMKNYIFHSNTIFVQLVSFTIIVSLIPILIISTFLFQKITGTVTDNLASSHSQLVIQYMYNVKDKISQYRKSLHQISNNTIILDTLRSNNQQDNPYIKGNKISIEVTKSLQLESHNELRNCMVYSDLSENAVYGPSVAMMKGAESEIWYLNHQATQQDYFIYSAPDGKNEVLSLIQNIVFVDTKQLKREYIGFIKLDIVMQKLFAPASGTARKLDYPYDIVLLDSQNRLIYSSNTQYKDIVNHISLDKLEKSSDIFYYEDAMVNYDTMEDYGLKFIFLFNNTQLNQEIREMSRSILPAIFIILFIIILMGFFFTRDFSKRVALLVKKIKVAETGDLTIRETIEGNDEIAALDHQFNQMLIKLESLIQKNYIQQLEKKETEFRNLQLQINPHFLYNTLEVISSIAAVNQSFVICELCQKLGGIFRYSLGKDYGEFVPVIQEIQHTQNYVFIQKTRFVNKFEVFYNISKGLESKKILRFILQPIVENAIIHGLSRMEGTGALEISVCKENRVQPDGEIKENLLVKIEDDGIGMSAERVKILNDYINSENGGKSENRQSIGIRNVNQRIKFACGEDYGVTVESIEGKGSCVMLRLPIIEEGEILSG